MPFEVEGVMHRVFDTEQKTASFQVREFVLEVPDGNYPQLIKFQLAQDRVNLLDTYAVGEKIKVHFDLRGREWQGKYFTTLNCWRLEKMGNEERAATPPPPASNPAPSFPSANDEPPAMDDLPF